jgi:hypothetical protein
LAGAVSHKNTARRWREHDLVHLGRRYCERGVERAARRAPELVDLCDESGGAVHWPAHAPRALAGGKGEVVYADDGMIYRAAITGDPMDSEVVRYAR